MDSQDNILDSQDHILDSQDHILDSQDCPSADMGEARDHRARTPEVRVWHDISVPVISTYVMTVLTCGPDCLTCDPDCLICYHDCLICGPDCLIC